MRAAKQKPPPIMTVDEFLAWAGADRYELVDGEVRAMSPASSTHGTVQLNLGRLIADHLDRTGSPCRALTEPAIAVRIRANVNLRVPDIGVTCAPDAAGQIALPDPLLLVEILSPGNARETWSNVWAYTSVPSVREILIVQASRIEAQLLRRGEDGAWPPDPTTIASDATLELHSVGLSTPLRAIYAKTYLVS